MGTAGSVGLLRDLISSTCVVGSGDAVASFDIASLLKAHRESGAKVRWRFGRLMTLPSLES